MRRGVLALAAGSLLVQACSSPCISDEPSGAAVRFADTGSKLGDFLAHPWPSDARRRSGANLDLDALPNPGVSSTLRDYVHLIGQSTRAYSTSAALYLSFTAPIDGSRLSNDPLSALGDDSPVQLVDVDPESPERGRRYPLNFRYSNAATEFLPAHHLITLPPFGVPLAGGTTYALLVKKSIGAEASVNTNNALHEECTDDAPGALSALFAPLRRFLADTRISAGELAGATVFTTQDSLADMRELAAAARAQPAPVLQNVERHDIRGPLVLIKGTVELPGWQKGELPYRMLGDGGELARDSEGNPVVDHYETTRVSFTIPRPASGFTMPEEGWPVVLYSHGTGGDYTGAYDREVADVLGAFGIAVVGYDQTLHGPRDPTESDPNLTFFNLFNPIAARDNIRQGSADLVAMVNFLHSGIELPADVTGFGPARFDPARVAFLGHSQGALVAAPFIATEDRLRAVVFSGLGAILTITLLERKDIIDFKGFLESVLSLQQPLEDLHPVLNLIQTFIEPADPISYARSYIADPPGNAAFDILQVEGFKDFASPARGQEAFSAAANIPLVAPAWRIPLGSLLMGLEPQPAPVSANVTTRNGQVTFGLIQYPEETHYPIFENAGANARYAEFLRSALFDGRARIIAEE